MLELDTAPTIELSTSNESFCINRLQTSSWGKSSTTQAHIPRWNPSRALEESEPLEVSAVLLRAFFLIPAADRRISAILHSSVVASRSDLVGCAGAEGAVDLHSLAFDFVSSFGFVFVSEAADDDDGFAGEGSERRFSAFGGACGSPVAALNVERSDWKLMVTVPVDGWNNADIRDTPHPAPQYQRNRPSIVRPVPFQPQIFSGQIFFLRRSALFALFHSLTFITYLCSTRHIQPVRR